VDARPSPPTTGCRTNAELSLDARLVSGPDAVRDLVAVVRVGFCSVQVETREVRLDSNPSRT
jgi:hypothetical protein